MEILGRYNQSCILQNIFDLIRQVYSVIDNPRIVELPYLSLALFLLLPLATAVASAMA